MNKMMLCNYITLYSLSNQLRYYEFERVCYDQRVVIIPEALKKENGVSVKFHILNVIL